MSTLLIRSVTRHVRHVPTQCCCQHSHLLSSRPGKCQTTRHGWRAPPGRPSVRRPPGPFFLYLEIHPPPGGRPCKGRRSTRRARWIAGSQASQPRGSRPARVFLSLTTTTSSGCAWPRTMAEPSPSGLPKIARASSRSASHQEPRPPGPGLRCHGRGRGRHIASEGKRAIEGVGIEPSNFQGAESFFHLSVDGAAQSRCAKDS